ncbi:MAG: hypothetical protein K8R64_08940 [Methanosarcinaceae archaeon]|nr:hypothetical protein [Methanosarcinaceae archaeon]
MTDLTEIQQFFLLEHEPQLFEIAIRPRSCGGTAKFEQLALYGDRVIDIHLYDYLISKGWETSGDITSCKNTIHKESTIKAFADYLSIPSILTSSDLTCSLQDKDLAEIVEALIGAAFKTNGLDKCSPIVRKFIEFAITKQDKLSKEGIFDPSKDYKSKFLNDIRKIDNISNKEIGKFIPTAPRNGGPDHSIIFQFTDEIPFSITLEGVTHKITTMPWNSAIEAEQEAAHKALCAIKGQNPEYDPTMDTLRPIQEKTVHSNVSINDKEIIFYKPESQNRSMEVKNNTDELLIDYVKRKASKNSFGLLMLLSARLDDVTGASWIRETSSDVLALLNLQLGEENYFTVGYGSSNTQARKDAGNKMLIEASFFEWVEKNYLDYRI